MNNHENIGYLTWEQWQQFQNAVHTSTYLEPWLRAAGYIRTELHQPRNPTNNHPLGLPPTWIAAQTIKQLQNALAPYPNLEDAANNTKGAQIAQQLTHEVQNALHKWPIEDKPRTIQHIRCHQCQQLTLQYQPPTHHHDNITINCTTCPATLTPEQLAHTAQLLATELQQARKKTTWNP